MYIPPYFKQEDWSEIQQFIKANSFATLVSMRSDYPVATHIPVELETNPQEELVLWGHIARANSQWKTFEEHSGVLVIFQSYNSYVSSSWYEEPEVPTWNYRAVHVYGCIKELSGDVLRESLRRQIDRYEQDSECPVSMSSLPDSVVDSQIKGIFGFEISIEQVEAADKLSQNRTERDQDNIIQKLSKKKEAHRRGIAEAMRKNRKNG